MPEKVAIWCDIDFTREADGGVIVDCLLEHPVRPRRLGLKMVH